MINFRLNLFTSIWYEGHRYKLLLATEFYNIDLFVSFMHQNQMKILIWTKS